MTIQSIFNAYSRYYDLLYQDKNYVAEFEYTKTLLSDNGVDKGELLEFGSGTGKHGRIFADHGYQVTGIERSAEMVAQVSQTRDFTCHQGDIRHICLHRKFDAVLSLFHVISYQIQNEDVQAVFSRAAEHLRPEGLFLFDVWYSPAVYTQRPKVQIKRITDDTVEIIRIAEPVIYTNENRVDVNYTILVRDKLTGHCKKIFESHPMRHFSLPEIDFFAKSNGFKRINAEEFLTGKVPGVDTWGICLLYRKI